MISILPQIEAPLQAVTMESKQIWTAIIILIYLLCCQIPLYGIIQSEESDPFQMLRFILASNRGTLMELGISPIITASMVMQLLSGAKLLKVDQSIREERELYEGAQKIVGLLISLGQAFAYTWSGMYGDIASIGAGNAVLIILQLTFASFITILLDDIVSKGYGIGNSGTSLFIAISMAENILWHCFSPLAYKTSANKVEQYEGAFVELIYSILFRENKIGAIQEAFFRDSQPNIVAVFSTVLVFIMVIYFQGFKYNIRLSSNKTTMESSYPVRLFYTSNMPIILQSALVSNVFLISQMLYRNFKGSLLASLFGVWQESGYRGQTVPVGGLIYYITSPHTLFEALMDPIHTIIYCVFVIGSNSALIQHVPSSAGLGSTSAARGPRKSPKTSGTKACS